MGENNEHGQTLRAITAVVSPPAPPPPPSLFLSACNSYSHSHTLSLYQDAAEANLRDGRHAAAEIASMYQASGNERTG